MTTSAVAEAEESRESGVQRTLILNDKHAPSMLAPPPRGCVCVVCAQTRLGIVRRLNGINITHSDTYTQLETLSNTKYFFL